MIVFLQGTSAEQDNRFIDKNKKLMKTMKFAEGINTKVACQTPVCVDKNRSEISIATISTSFEQIEWNLFVWFYRYVRLMLCLVYALD